MHYRAGLSFPTHATETTGFQHVGPSPNYMMGIRRQLQLSRLIA